MHHGKKKKDVLSAHYGTEPSGTMGEKVDGKSKRKEEKKSPPRALKTGGAAELMGERRQAFFARGYYVHNGDAFRVGEFLGGNGESGNCYQAEDRMPRCSKREMKGCDRLLPPPLPPPTISSEFHRLLRDCGAASSR